MDFAGHKRLQKQKPTVSKTINITDTDEALRSGQSGALGYGSYFWKNWVLRPDLKLSHVDSSKRKWREFKVGPEK